MIADSVQGLRSFLNELDIEDSSVPDNLINALEDFMTTIEPQECNLIILNNSSKIKLFKDWKSYSERFKNDEDDILFWKEKKLKSTSSGKVLLLLFNHLYLGHMICTLYKKFCIDKIQYLYLYY